jgi:hemerythrin-like domain-containing protein
MAKVELRNIIVDLERKYDALNNEYVDECAKNFMSRRATYLDGQLAIMRDIIEMLDDANEDEVVDEIVESMFEEEEEDFDEPIEDDVSEIGYNPYTGGYDLDC